MFRLSPRPDQVSTLKLHEEIPLSQFKKKFILSITRLAYQSFTIYTTPFSTTNLINHFLTHLKVPLFLIL